MQGGSSAPSAPPLTAEAMTPAQAAAAAALQRAGGATDASTSVACSAAGSSSDKRHSGEAAREQPSCSICLDEFEEGSQVRAPLRARGLGEWHLLPNC